VKFRPIRTKKIILQSLPDYRHFHQAALTSCLPSRSSIAAVLIAQHCLALIKHGEINDHPIEVVAQYFTSL